MHPNLQSRVSGFYKMSPEERLRLVAERTGLDAVECEYITKGLTPDVVDHLAENVIGSIGIPLGVAVNFRMNDRDYFVPMATDESSVIAAASNGSRMARVLGGFKAECSDPIMAVQIQVGCKGDPKEAQSKVEAHKESLIEMANTRSTTLPKMGAGAKSIHSYIVEGFYGSMVILRLLVDVRDAMGANVVNTMAEFIAPEIERITGETVYLKVVDNHAIERVARASCVIEKEVMGGETVVDRFLHGYSCAYHDIHRATGHNKGTMNGITAVVLATGNDTRAMESACHSYAARSGVYRPLPKWGKDNEGNLTGEIEIPVPVGIIGGLTKSHPVARACLKIMGIESAGELGMILASIGLASKMAAERALAAEGIQQGHMSMHATNIAMIAGATGDEIKRVAHAMIQEKMVSTANAAKHLKDMRGV